MSRAIRPETLRASQPASRVVGHTFKRLPYSLGMYHVQIDGQTRGPYVLDQIRSMWAAGIITADAV